MTNIEKHDDTEFLGDEYSVECCCGFARGGLASMEEAQAVLRDHLASGQ